MYFKCIYAVLSFWKNNNNKETKNKHIVPSCFKQMRSFITTPKFRQTLHKSCTERLENLPRTVVTLKETWYCISFWLPKSSLQILYDQLHVTLTQCAICSWYPMKRQQRCRVLILQLGNRKINWIILQEESPMCTSSTLTLELQLDNHKVQKNYSCTAQST